MYHGFHAKVISRGLNHPLVWGKTSQAINTIDFLSEVLAVKVSFQLEFDDLTESVS